MGKFTVRCTTSPKGSKKAAPVKKAGGPVADLVTDLQDQMFVCSGVDKQGSPVDISADYTVTAVSDAPDIFSVDAPVGQNVQGHAALAGSANITFTETPNVASTPPVDPFTWVQPVTISGTAATGFVVTPGVPVTRP
jgi:hypothetical protein